MEKKTKIELLFYNILFNGFMASTFLMMIGRIVWPSKKLAFDKLTVISNTLLLAGACCYLIFSIYLCKLYNSSEEWQKYAWKTRLLGPSWFIYYGRILFKGILPQLLWIKKLRESSWSSCILIPFFLIDIYLPWIYQTQQSYLPATQSFRLNYVAVFFSTTSYLILVMIIFLIKKRIKLQVKK